MANPQPGSAKRRVMGRMDIGGSESHTSTPTTTRPRIVRAQHSASSSLSFATPPSQASRPSTATTGRAKVDMSALVGSPTMSPPLARHNSFASPSTFSATPLRAAAPSPSIRTPNGANTPSRPLSAVGVPIATVASPDTRADVVGDTSFVSLRNHRARGKQGSVDLNGYPSLPGSPIPPNTIDLGLPACSTYQRSPLPRSQTSATLRAHANVSSPAHPPTARASISSARTPTLANQLIPRSSRSRSPSPSRLEPPRTTTERLAPPYEGPIYADHAGSDYSPEQHALPLPELSSPQLRRRSSMASTSSSAATAANALEAKVGMSMTMGRSHARSNSALQRAPIPHPLSMHNVAPSSAPLSPGATSPTSRTPVPLSRGSFGSQGATARDAALRSPTSETSGVSTLEQAEAEEARRNRKLLDLEITNKSLMAINAALEVTKLKQAREIRDLKRRLRDGRGLSLAPGEIGALASPGDEDDDYYFEDADEGLEEDPELEAAHMRCKNLIDQMLTRARTSILSSYEPPQSTGGKVLHPSELEQMQQEQGVTEAAPPSEDPSFSRDADNSFLSRSETVSSAFDISSADVSRDSAGATETTPEIAVDSSFAADPSFSDDHLEPNEKNGHLDIPTISSRPFGADVSID